MYLRPYVMQRIKKNIYNIMNEITKVAYKV